MTPRFSCQVCGKGLRSQVSIALGVGPVCARRVRAIVQGMLEATGQIATGFATRTAEMFRSAIENAQVAYRNRIRSRRNQEQGATEQNDSTITIPEDRIVSGVWSAARQRDESISIQFSDENHALAISGSGNQYQVTESTCTCPHYQRRLQNTGGSCRHIEAFNAARRTNGVNNTADLANSNVDQTDRLAIPITEEVHEENRRDFFRIDWTDEQEREQVLNIWRENRAFNGVFMSEDDNAWQELYDNAGHDWEYKYENVLGGTGNTFGIELEFELPANVSKSDVARALYEADIIDSPTVHSYHQGRSGPGYWKLENDGSLIGGMELVSPVLSDKPEHWEQIEKATKVLREKGVKTSVRTGGHIHVGIAPLNHRTYSWQRLARIGLAYERIFYRMGGADSLEYEASGRPGVHRGSQYSKPLPSTSRLIRSTDTAAEARSKLSNERRTLFNTKNVDALMNRKPTLEMRYPNSSIDHKQIQAQVIIANSVVHQAAVIRNESPLNRFTPGLGQINEQYRLENISNQQREEKSFRSFLDVLGNNFDRLAATWLYRRGSVN